MVYLHNIKLFKGTNHPLLLSFTIGYHGESLDTSMGRLDWLSYNTPLKFLTYIVCVYVRYIYQLIPHITKT